MNSSSHQFGVCAPIASRLRRWLPWLGVLGLACLGCNDGSAHAPESAASVASSPAPGSPSDTASVNAEATPQPTTSSPSEATSRHTSPPEPVEQPTDAKPVVASATLEPTTAAPGDDLTMTVRVRVAPAWHIYAVGNAGAAGVPTRLELSLPDGLEPAGDWVNPEPDVRPTSLGPEYILHGEAVFRQTLRIADAATPGRLEAACIVTYQACNQSRCLLPAKAAAAAACTITSPTE